MKENIVILTIIFVMLFFIAFYDKTEGREDHVIVAVNTPSALLMSRSGFNDQAGRPGGG